MSWSGTVYCSSCHQQGHNKRGCPQIKEYIEANPDSYQAKIYQANAAKAKIRRCSYCSEEGHNRSTCGVKKGHVAQALEAQERWMGGVKDWMVEHGAGVGALVTYADGYSGDRKTGIIKRMHMSRALFLANNDSWKGDFIYVTPLNDSSDRAGRFLRPPQDCPGFHSNEWSGACQLDSIISPISGSLVGGQFDNPHPPHRLIYDMFKGHMNEGAHTVRNAATEVLAKYAE